MIMAFTDVLWLLIWGGMFSGIYNLQAPGLLSSPAALFQGFRSLLPILSVYIGVIWILATRARFPFSGISVGYLFYYCSVGLFTSVFLSPDKITALYWGSAYMSPLLITWMILDRNRTTSRLRSIIYMNYIFIFGITLSLLPEALRVGLKRSLITRFYKLPLGLGQILANGVGRFALILIIVSFIRLITRRSRARYVWLLPLLSSLFLLIQTESRTSLVGLAIASILFVLLMGLNWRLIFVGPVASYVIWFSAFKLRARGSMERLIQLSGREYTWQKGLAQIKQSPVLGWGFHADRILLRSEHMHNSYLHAMIHSGIVGASFFVFALITFWAFVVKSGLFAAIKSVPDRDRPLLMESIMILGFLTARSFFESTAAFYGVDLLLMVPAMAYVYVWALGKPGAESIPMPVSAGSGAWDSGYIR